MLCSKRFIDSGGEEASTYPILVISKLTHGVIYIAIDLVIIVKFSMGKHPCQPLKSS